LQDRVDFIKSDKTYKDFDPNFDKLFAKANFTNKKLLPKQNLSLKVYRNNDSKQDIKIQSFHYFPLQVLGFGDEMNMIEELGKPLFVESYNAKSPASFYSLKASAPVDYIYYKTLGLDQVFKVKLSKSNAPIQNLPTIKADLASLLALPFVSQLGKELLIGEGKHEINKPIVVPVGYKLVIDAGVELQFNNGASFCSYSEVIAKGSKQKPIVFSSDGTAGLMILDEQGFSEFENCKFVGLGSFKNRNVSSEGAVGIYKSKTNFKACDFINIKSKEALSIRNADVTLIESIFKNVQGTAIKSSYSSLKLTTVEMEDVGKNGLSASSGKVEAGGVVMKKVLNKAFNFTDNTDVNMTKVDLFDSYQSLYINDHSKVKIIRFWNQNIEKGIELRSSMDPSPSVDIQQFNYNNVKQLFLIKQGTDK